MAISTETGSMLNPENKVKTFHVVPRDLRSIPDVLPFRDLVNGPMDLELNLNELKRCMNFGYCSCGDTLIDETNFVSIFEEEDQSSKEDGGLTDQDNNPETTNVGDAITENNPIMA